MAKSGKSRSERKHIRLVKSTDRRLKLATVSLNVEDLSFGKGADNACPYCYNARGNQTKTIGYDGRVYYITSCNRCGRDYRRL
ncbi:MAG: hypothetical protein ACOZBH_02705 [Patescibacteria group bacterium]